MPFTDEEYIDEKINLFRRAKMLPALKSIKARLKTNGFKLDTTEDQDRVFWREEDNLPISFRLILVPLTVSHRIRLESEYHK